MENSYLMSHEDALKYIMGGKAGFTILNIKTGKQFSYTTYAKKYVHYVFYCGEYIGYISKKSKVFAESMVDLKNLLSPKDQSALQFKWIWDRLNESKLPNTIQFYHHGTCSVCGKPLTDPESIKRGMGNICASRI